MSTDGCISCGQSGHRIFPLHLFADVEYALRDLVYCSATETRSSVESRSIVRLDPSSAPESVAASLVAVLRGKYAADFEHRAGKGSRSLSKLSYIESAPHTSDGEERKQRIHEHGTTLRDGADSNDAVFCRERSKFSAKPLTKWSWGMRCYCHTGSLRSEIVYLNALAQWTASELTPLASEELALQFGESVLESVFHSIIKHHLPDSFNSTDTSFAEHDESNSVALHIPPTTLPSQDFGDKRMCQIWASKSHARLGIMRDALAARYGSVSSTPTATAIAGAPLIVYIRGEVEQNNSICTHQAPSKLDFSTSKGANNRATEWENICTGTCVFKSMQVGHIGDVRNLVSSYLKNAVTIRGLSPILVILEVDVDATLCNTAKLLHALCESYGAKLHIEGSALPALFLHREVLDSLQLEVQFWLKSANSILLDVGSWFGYGDFAAIDLRKACGNCSSSGSKDDDRSRRVSCGKDFVYSIAETNATSLPHVMSLWWFLQRVDLRSIGSWMNVLCAQSVALLDQLSPFTYLLETIAIGSGLNVLITYVSESSNLDEQERVNRAILSHISMSETVHMPNTRSLGGNGAKFLLYSPLETLQHYTTVCSPPTTDSMCFAKELLEAAHNYRIARAGAAVFSTIISQCDLLELADVALTDIGPLAFGAVRVVPLGLTAKNGHWQHHAEMMEKVEKYTCALAAAMSTYPTLSFKAVLYDKGEKGTFPFVYVGPATVDVQQINVKVADTIDGAFLSERQQLVSQGAKALAQEAGEATIHAAQLVLNQQNFQLRADKTEFPLLDRVHSCCDEDFGSSPSSPSPNSHQFEQNVQRANSLENPESTKNIADQLSCSKMQVTLRDSRKTDMEICNASKDNQVVGDFADAQMSPSTVTNRDTRQISSPGHGGERFGLWSRLFGQAESSSHESDSATDSSQSSGESDFFRP